MTLIDQFVLVLSYHDRSGIIQAVGPFDTVRQAEEASAALQALPMITGALWEVIPCTGFNVGAATPADGV